MAAMMRLGLPSSGWFGIGVGLGKEAVDGRLQVDDRAENAALVPAAGQLCEEALRGIELTH